MGVHLVLTTITYFLPQIQAFVSGKVVDEAIGHISTGESIVSSSFLIILGILMLVFLVASIVHDLDAFVEQMFNLRLPVYRDRVMMSQYLRFSPQLYERSEFISVKNKLEWNMWKIDNAVRELLVAATSAFSAIGMVILMVNYDWRIVIVTIVSIIPSLYLTFRFGKRVWSIWDSQGEEKILFNVYRRSLFVDSPSQFQEVSILGYGKYFLKKSLGFNLQFNERLINNERKRLNLSVAFQFIQYACVATAYFLVFRLLFNHQITVGEFFFVLSIYGGLRSGLSFTFNQITRLQADSNILETFHTLINYQNPIISGNRKINTKKPLSISFDNVWFRYPGTKNWIFKGISFSIESDQDLAIVGKNGAGKTTLIKLLMRVYDPDKGTITINGVDLKSLNLKHYYKSLGILSQDFNQLDVTVKENITIGNPFKKPSLKDARAAAKLAKADAFISRYPRKYDTYLTRELKDGILPSGGQWQRIAIARIFYRKPKLIILDEPTSAIDSIAEEQIFRNIQKYGKGKTTIIVSHRFATVRKAKRIIVLDKGKLVEDGTHAELMKNHKLYSMMYTKQQQ